MLARIQAENPTPANLFFVLTSVVSLNERIDTTYMVALVILSQRDNPKVARRLNAGFALNNDSSQRDV